MSGGRNVAAETRTQKCGIICGENVIEQFEIGMSAKRRFAMGSPMRTIVNRPSWSDAADWGSK